jgi:hypothetical protein
MWPTAYADDVTGTETQVAALKPAYLRVGGYNNDANVPNPFNHAELDKMVAYARAIGAEPVLQVPVLGDIDGSQPTAATAAEMVTYANVTQGYGIKYFSVGNEPDIYADQASSTAPSRPGYTPADYCATTASFVAAMKAVDPTIKIVGPDLGWRYQAGNGTNDWLTPILQTCGNLLDVVSIHRYPFEAAMATLPAASADRTAFRQVITSVRGIMQATGQGQKPLALMEMNVAYDATSCVLQASPATVGGGLWLADALGSAIQLGLWTSAVWDISDDENYALGLIGSAPGHVPRPAYYAYLLYAEHFGPTLAGVSSAPSGVSAYASRNQANDATDIIYVNWNTADVGVEVQVTGLATPPAAPTFRLPAASFGAIQVSDSGPAMAWAYGEAERKAAAGPQPLAMGTAPAGAVDGGAAGTTGAGHVVGTNCPGSGTFVCPTVPVSDPVITKGGKSVTGGVTFGSGTNAWGSYSYAAPGQTAPIGTATSDGNGLRIQGGFVAPVNAAQNYIGFGLYFNNTSCLDASSHTGIQFELTGSLGGCLLAAGVNFSADLAHTDDAAHGGCTGTCYGPSADVTAQATGAADAGVTVKVPFTQYAGGMPVSGAQPGSIVDVQWQLSAPVGRPDAGGCSADFTVSNVSFY